MSVELAAVEALREPSEDDDRTACINGRGAEKAAAASGKPISIDQVESQPTRSLGSAAVDALEAAVREGQDSLEDHLILPRTSPIIPLERLKPFSYWEELKNRSASFGLTRGAHRPRPSPSLLDEDLSWEDSKRRFPPVFPYAAKDHDWSKAPTVCFPLSPDHRLLVLIQFNVFRGMLTNMAILSLIDRVPIECGMVLFAQDFPPAPEVLPPSLQETWLQQQTPHDMWIDSFPWGGLRDNIISYQNLMDEEEFCVDVLGGLFEGFNNIEVNGLLVWGEPWSETGWEVTPGFAKKWGYLLKGCDTLIEATNQYRAARGEDRLVIEI
ncbi:hypothetical protein CHU98_g3650 [Xylaria longipes]|nr:hypothetical protein CHU98_g3650 [Xylaria longipes]